MTDPGPDTRLVGIMVAHPDDETLWGGGVILRHPRWRCRIWTLCRASDPDRAPKYRAVLQRLGAEGKMADLDDGPDQHPLPETDVERTIAQLAGRERYDLFITHAPWGEYTRHLRHNETSRAVTALWSQGELCARELWMFAYEDGGRAYLPRAREDADVVETLPPEVWREKYRIMHEIYGFTADSWEARATPRVEAFQRFAAPAELPYWSASMRETR